MLWMNRSTRSFRFGDATGLEALFICMAAGLLSYGGIMLFAARKQL
jgi:hypothetical protein